MIHPERYGLYGLTNPPTSDMLKRYGLPTPPQRPPAPEAIGAPATATVTTGIFEEEADQNPEAAIRSYQAVISGFDSQRANVANAIFRLGECYRKLGRMEEAKVQYARILREFTDLTPLVQSSQKHLATPTPQPRAERYGRRFSTGSAGGGFGGGGSSPEAAASYRDRLSQILVPATSSTPPVYSVQGNPAKERELLAQEIALVEQQILILKKHIENGSASQEQLIPLQHDILKLQRQMAALEEVIEPAGAERRPTPEVEQQKAGLLLGQSAEDPLSQSAMLKRQLDQVQTERMNIESKQLRNQALLNMVDNVSPVNLPEKAAADPRYQELKKVYEKSVLAADSAAREKASQQLSTWVKEVYLPELVEAEKAYQIELKFYTSECARLAQKLKDRQKEEEKRKQPAGGHF